jgi:hypothetical protein
MKKHFFYTLLFLACAYGDVFAQPFYKVYGGTGGDEARGVIRLSDGNFALVGTYDNAGDSDIIVIKISPSGAEIWKKIIQLPGEQLGRALYELPNGDIAIGAEQILSGINRYTYVISLSANGTIVNWTNSFLLTNPGGCLSDCYQSDNFSRQAKFALIGGTLIYGCDYRVSSSNRIHLFAINPLTGANIWQRRFNGGNISQAVGLNATNTFQMDFFVKAVDTLLVYSNTGELWSNSDNQSCIYFISPIDGLVKRAIHRGLNPASFGGTRAVKTLGIPRFAANSLDPTTVINIYTQQSVVNAREICITRRSLTNLTFETIGGGVAGDGKMRRFFYAGTALGGVNSTSAFESATNPGHTWILGSASSLLAADQIGAGTSDGYIGRFDANLNLVLSQIIGGSGNDVFTNAVAIPGGGVMAVGTTTSVGSGLTDILIARIAEDGSFDVSPTCSGGAAIALTRKPLTFSNENATMSSLPVDALSEAAVATTAATPVFTALDFTFINTTCLLPIDFIGFSGKETPMGDKLAWSISSNNDLVKEFTVEYSSNGIVFNTIATMVPNSNEQTNYNYTNAINSKEPRVYYRIKCVDNNNQFKYSSTINLSHLAVTKNVIKVYHAEERNSVAIGILAEESQSCLVRIFDEAGRLLLQEIKQLNKGINAFNCSNAAMGNSQTWVITVKTNHFPLKSVRIVK